ncbi:hypothetical protein BG621_04025 [Parasaccharibacter apium]|nr:hypothetical protein BG621_04025 [Parasaccharibacter apium]
MSLPPVIHSSLLPVPHGFCLRQGGVSRAPYESLNGGVNTQDDPTYVQANRQRIAALVGVEEVHLAALQQVHGAEVVTLRGSEDVPSFSYGALPEGDGLVTDCPTIALGIATADCAPVLFASHDGRVVGAAHAGWRGAVAGVLEATVQQMRALGAEGIRAVIGPCIASASYEVGEDMRCAVLAHDPAHESSGGRFFTPAARTGHYQFDLPAFCLARLEALHVRAEWVGRDTAAETCFFSHRRATLRGDGRTGRQLSIIRAITPSS